MSSYSGLGSTHQHHLEALKSGSLKGYKVNEVHEYERSGNPLSRIWKRWFSGPKNVALLSQNSDITHITDQEQAILCPVGGKSVITIHDLFHVFPFEHDGVKIGDNAPSLIRKRDLKKMKQGIQRASMLVCISKYTQKECEMRFPGIPTAYVPHAIDLEKYSIETTRPHWFSEGKNLLIIGSEEERKRVDFAINVCGGLDVTLHKIGAESSEKSKKKLRSLAVKSNCNLNWVGKLETDEMVAALQHADALLFPSVAEGFGLPPLEAYASGTIALVADAPAHNEIPLEEHILPVNDVEAWRNAISNLQPNPDAVRQRANEFSKEKWSKRMKIAYDSLF